MSYSSLRASNFSPPMPWSGAVPSQLPARTPRAAVSLPESGEAVAGRPLVGSGQAVLTVGTAVVHSIQSARKISSLRRANFGVTMGMVSMVLAMAINNSAVKVSLVMICLSNRTLAKIIMIKALV